MTLPLIRPQPGRQQPAPRIINTIKHHDNPKRVREVIDFVLETDGIAYSRDRMLAFRDEALVPLHELPVSDARNSLERLVHYTIERENENNTPAFVCRSCGLRLGDSVERIVKVYPNGNPERMVIYDASETNIIGEKFFYDDGGVRVEGPCKTANVTALGTLTPWKATYFRSTTTTWANTTVPTKTTSRTVVCASKAPTATARKSASGSCSRTKASATGCTAALTPRQPARKGVYNKGQKSGIWEEFNANGSRIGYSITEFF